MLPGLLTPIMFGSWIRAVWYWHTICGPAEIIRPGYSFHSKAVHLSFTFLFVADKSER